MNEKEKEAIEIINKITEDCEYICMQRNEDTELYSDKPVPYIENRILLNLIEKQEKMINEMASEIAQFRNMFNFVNDTKEVVIDEYKKYIGLLDVTFKKKAGE